MSKEDLDKVAPDRKSTALARKDEEFSRSIKETLSGAMKSAWQPIPVPKPKVDSGLPQLPAIQRSAEVFRYKLLQLEYGISPEGGLRGWLRLNVLLALLIGIPALLLVPIITFVLRSFASWTEFLLQAAVNLLYTIITLIAIGVIVATVGIIINQWRLKRMLKAQQDIGGHPSTSRNDNHSSNSNR